MMETMHGSRSRKGTFVCTAFLYTLLLSCVLVFFFVENHSPDDADTTSNGLERVFQLVQNQFTSESIYTQGEKLAQPKDEETAIAIAQSNEQKEKNSILSNDEDSQWPHWLGKYSFMPRPEEIADEDRICFVHVGKTAGSTMACELGFAYEWRFETGGALSVPSSP